MLDLFARETPQLHQLDVSSCHRQERPAVQRYSHIRVSSQCMPNTGISKPDRLALALQTVHPCWTIHSAQHAGLWRHTNLARPFSARVACTQSLSRSRQQLAGRSAFSQISGQGNRSTVLMASVSASSMPVEVIKSPADNKLYRHLVLENGLTVLLIHDPDMFALPSAAAANGQVSIPLPCVRTQSISHLNNSYMLEKFLI